MIHRFHEQVFQRMPPERKARRLAVMKALAKSVRNKNKENEGPLNNNMELPYNFIHSTPMKNQQVTNLDDIVSETSGETEFTESELGDIPEDEIEEGEETWGMEKPKLVISKIYDLSDKKEHFKSDSISQADEFVEDGVTVLPLNDLDESNERHWRSLEVLHENAEYEFCKSLEQSKLFVSTSSLLEEIEADLPSPYSLAKPFNHTFHTLSTYRTQSRLARVDGNVTCPDILKEVREGLDVGTTSRKIDRLEVEATVQKALAEQAEKALLLSKGKKFFGVEHVESEKALLLANLRCTAVKQEAKKLRMLGEVSEKESFGQITISDICFDVNDTKDSCPAKYICTATEREHVQSTAVVGEVTDGKLHFKEQLKFQDLNKDFVIYIDLFKLLFKEPKKALLASALMKKFRKMSEVNLNRSLTGASYSSCGFVCVSQSELRLENVVKTEDDKCVIQNYLTRNPVHPVEGSSVSLLAKTDIHVKTRKSGFLNAFQQTWHRRWYCQSGYFFESWLYPEDRESDKAPVDSIYLPNCKSVQPVSIEVCVRPHSFAITLKEDDREVLFSASSHKDMLDWIDHLNLVLEQIRLWKPNL